MPRIHRIILCIVVGLMGPVIWTACSSKIPEEISGPIYEVRMTARQFAWDFSQPGPDGLWDTADDLQSVNQLVIPVGSRIRFYLKSKDVIHGFWIPRLGLRQTLVPGATLEKELAVRKRGQYKIACSELCGLDHAKMVGWLVVLDLEEYQRWQQKNPTSKVSKKTNNTN